LLKHTFINIRYQPVFFIDFTRCSLRITVTSFAIRKKSMSFDLSSTTSDDSSIVDIFALLPGGNNRKIDSDENKIISSLLYDSSSKVDNEHKTSYHKDTTNDDNATKQSLENSSEEAKDCQTRRYDDGHTIRVIMGKSVKNLRTQRNYKCITNSTTRTLMKSKTAYNKGTTQDSIDGNNIKPHANQPNYVVVQQRDASSDPKIKHIDFENSHLNVQRSSSGSNVRVDIVEESSTKENQKKETMYSTKKCKRQFSKHGNQTSLSSSAFVDCIAIWDPKRQVYVLEVPELIASDITIMPSSDNDCNIAATGVIDRHLNSNLDASHDVTAGNPARRRRQDPLKQQRQDETKLLNPRKRRRS
jgi:hypothetical protein